MASLSQRINNALHPFKRIRKEIKGEIDKLQSKLNIQETNKIAKALAFERFYQNQNINCEANFSKNHFVLFNYPYHFVDACGNLGDEIQSIATQKALDLVFENTSYEYFGRDCLAYFNTQPQRVDANIMGGGGLINTQ